MSPNRYTLANIAFNYNTSLFLENTVHWANFYFIISFVYSLTDHPVSLLLFFSQA